jgi:MFS family permease
MSRSAAAHRNLAVYLVGQGLSNVGTFSQLVALSLLVLEVSGSALALGVTMSVQAIPYLLLSPWAGPLLDRVPLRRLMMVTALVGASQAACLAVLAIREQIAVPWIVGLVSDHASPRVAVGLGAVSAIAVGVMLLLSWHLERLRAPDDPIGKASAPGAGSRPR